MKQLLLKLSTKSQIGSYACLGLACVLLSAVPAHAQTVTEVTVPNALSTRVKTINSQGVIAGSYLGNDLAIYGFIDNQGLITSFTGPSNAAPVVSRINDLNSVIGWYNDTQLQQHAFLRMPSGKMVKIAPPNADATYPMSIDDGNNVAGYFRDTNNLTHGFILNGSHYTVVDFPGASLTKILDMNSQGIAVGLFQDAAGMSHGFFWLAPVGCVQIDAPGSAGTQILRIDASGRMIGISVRQSNTTGFLFNLYSGTTTTIAPPGYSSSYAVSFFGPAGAVLGGLGTVDANSLQFVDSGDSFCFGSSGQYSALSNLGYVKFLDANTQGVAIGTYIDQSNQIHSFQINLSSMD